MCTCRENIPVLSSFGCGIMLLEGRGHVLLMYGENEMQDIKWLDQTHVPRRVGAEGESRAACLVIQLRGCASPA